MHWWHNLYQKTVLRSFGTYVKFNTTDILKTWTDSYYFPSRKYSAVRSTESGRITDEYLGAIVLKPQKEAIEKVETAELL